MLDLDKMKYYNISLQEVADATENVNNNVGGGILYEYGNEYIVKGNVNTRDLDVIAQSVVKSDSTGIVTIADIATVKIGSKTPKLGMASENGMPAVSLTITKQPNSDTNELTEKIISSLEEIKNNLPSDVNISTDTFMQSRFINNSISNIEHSLIEGAIFVVIVLFYRRAVKPIKAALGRSLRTIAAKPSFSSPVCVSPFVLVFDCVRWASSLIATARCKSVVQLVVQVKTVG